MDFDELSLGYIFGFISVTYHGQFDFPTIVDFWNGIGITGRTVFTLFIGLRGM